MEKIKYGYPVNRSTQRFTMNRKKTKNWKQLVKEVKENGDGELYLEFTRDELDQFGLKKGDKVEWVETEDGEVWKKVNKNEWCI